MANNYKELIVYQKAVELTVEVLNYLKNQKYDFAQKVLSDQLIRAISSIGANIAEGYGRYYQKNYYQFLSIARGSSFETDYWLDIIQGGNFGNRDKIKAFILKNEEITKMLTSLMKNLEKGDNRIKS